MVAWARQLSVCAAVASVVSANVAPGLSIKGAPTLNATWGENDIDPSGELLNRSDTANPPTNILSPVWTTRGRAVLMLIDTSITTDTDPASNTTINSNQHLHWLTSNVTMPLTETQRLKLPPSSQFEVAYEQPAPPKDDPAHNYTLLLFSQPENFTIPARFRSIMKERSGFDAAAFANATGLGNALAANWVRVKDGPATAPSSSATKTAATPSATGGSNATASGGPTQEYPGAAVNVDARGWVAGLASLGAMAAMVVAL